jgi:hypothetical protein
MLRDVQPQPPTPRRAERRFGWVWSLRTTLDLVAKQAPARVDCSTASSTAFLSSLPSGEKLPLKEAMKPTLIGPGTGGGLRGGAALQNPWTQWRLKTVD